jgi:hypothetical protein
MQVNARLFSLPRGACRRRAMYRGSAPGVIQDLIVRRRRALVNV